MSTPTTDIPTTVTTQVHRIYIRASAEAIWEAITKPEWTNRYGYTGYADYDLRPGGLYVVRPNEEFKASAEQYGFPCPDIVVDGEVLEVDPPHRLVTTWRMNMDAEIAAEGYTKLTHEINVIDDAYCSYTITHEVEGHPKVAALVSGALEAGGDGGGGGHPWVLSDLKSLLETGTTLAGRSFD
jgi:uncharacterized protein YndB with AHSA1/START domain